MSKNIKKINICNGTLVYHDTFREKYVYKCDKCKRISIFLLEPKSHKCKDNI